MPLGLLVLSALALLCTLLWPAPARAQSCTVSANPMNFGSIYTASNQTNTMTATWSVACTGTAFTSILVCPRLGIGSYGAAATGPRKMGFGTNLLNFDVFTTSAGTQRYSNDIFDSTTPPTYFVTGSNGQGTTTLTLYGRIPANQQSAALGAYSTALSATIGYGYSNSYGSCTAAGATATSTMTVSANNQVTCTITTAPVAFGSVALLDANVDAVGTVQVTCSATAAYAVGMNGGANGGTSATTRMMAGGAERITYALYRDAARTQGWYSDSGSSLSGTGTGSAQSLSVYGRVPVQHTPTPGLYSDSVIVTLTY